jgi:hypothetical protein
MADPKEPKIFIDDDWKRQAQEEKKRLAEQEKEKEQKKEAVKAVKAAETEAEAAGPAEEQALPPVGFDVLINSFATQAMLSMGVVKHPNMGHMVNLELAKFNIDLLGVLEEKTKGNLSQEEQETLNQMLYQLRMMFVEVSAAHAGPIGSK